MNPIEPNPDLGVSISRSIGNKVTEIKTTLKPLTDHANAVLSNSVNSIGEQKEATLNQAGAAFGLLSQDVPKRLEQLAIFETIHDLLKTFNHALMEKWDQNLELTALSHKKNARFNPEKLAERLLLKHKDPEKVYVAAQNLFKEDARFNNSTEEFKIKKEDREKVLSHLWQAVNASQIISKPISPEKQKKLQKDISFDLVGLVYRTPITLHGEGNEITQTHGHVEGNQYIEGTAVSANLGITEQKNTETPNQAIVASKEKVFVNRSARTNTKDKIFDKSTAGIIAMYKTETKQGLKPMLNSSGAQLVDSNNRPIYTTCRSDVTLMDLSLPKALVTTLVSGSKGLVQTMQGKQRIPLESERAFIQSKRKSSHEYWQQNGQRDQSGRYYIDREMDLENAQGITEKVCIREYEPLVFNFVFSGQAKDPVHVKTAREDNIPGALTLFKSWSAAEPKLLNYAQILKDDPPSKFQLKQFADFIQADLEDKTFSEKEEVALRGLLITLTGKDLDGTDYDNLEGADEQFIFLSHLSDMAGSPISVECKSGNDRTAAAVSLRCAMIRFEEKFGRPYDPKERNALNDDFNHFKELFNTFMVAFSPSNLKASRGFAENGLPDMKSRTSRAATKYLDMEKITQYLNIV